MWRRSVLRLQNQSLQRILSASSNSSGRSSWMSRAQFHTTRRQCVIKPFLLADIGEGIRECEIIQWFVEPGAKVEQFDNICEVQSDKASVEISSRYDGVIKKLYYEAGDMAIVGKPLVDIDMAEEVEEGSATEESTTEPTKTDAIKSDKPLTVIADVPVEAPSSKGSVKSTEPSGRHASLATPAVRRLVREHGLVIEDIKGTGRDGRVMKDDVAKHAEAGSTSAAAQASTSQSASAPSTPTKSSSSSQAQKSQPQIPTNLQEETTIPLTPIQNQMFKTMTKSISIPHFLYTDEVILDPLVRMRTAINKNLPSKSSYLAHSHIDKITYMPFFIKAVSLALNEYPIVNSRIDMADESRPKIVIRPQHNIGIAMDTPNGLIVPNIKNVNSLSILEIAAELKRLQIAGVEGKLSAADLKGGTITVSNIGNVGGTYLAPVIVSSEIAILGIGRSKIIPAFDDKGAVVPRTVVNFSWSADHRVLDGATMARMASLMKQYCEEPEMMTLHLR